MFFAGGTQDPRFGKLYYGWIIAIFSTLITMVNGGIVFSFGVFFSEVSLEFGWNRGEFAGNYTAMLLAYAPSAFFAGRLADRGGPRPILVLAGLLVGAGFIGCSFASNMASMTLSYISIGLGLGATLALPLATVQRWFLKWRGAMVGIVTAGIGLGGFIFAPLVNVLISHYDWRTAYLVIGLIFGGVMVASAAFLIAEPKMNNFITFGNRDQDLHLDTLIKNDAFHGLSWAQALRSGAFWGMSVLHILSFMPTFFILAHIVPFVNDLGISVATGARGLSLIAIMSVIGRLVMSWLAGKIGWMKSLTISYFCASVSIIGLMFVAIPEVFYLFAIFFGFFQGSTLALLGGAVGFFFGLPALSQILGFLLGLGVLGGAITPFLGGLSFDLTGSYISAIITSAIFFILAGLLSIVLRPPSRI